MYNGHARMCILEKFPHNLYFLISTGNLQFAILSINFQNLILSSFGLILRNLKDKKFECNANFFSHVAHIKSITLNHFTLVVHTNAH